ncbi:3-oxoacyl-ACP reductase [Psychromonas marina]|uniref:3-oxoacyl-ACP reductase n=1 Tax=Psychromonas marina TaxID=88364 RepID=A0ABQ6E4Q7_9GAMM|nr:SDR family oxidoreductase [Psychromonas marina]GLS92366.1 3-oxoacyl-ACP reductase [Psychromonas marina]
MNLNLNNKKALVMGGSTGIGKAIALSLVNEGVEVYICSRSELKLKACCDEIGAAGYEVCDLSVPLASKQLIDKLIKRIGQIDILVTNTGGPEKGSFLEVSDQQWQQDFQSLWMSPVESIKTILPIMKSNNYGRIILVTSVAAKEPIAGLTTSNGLRAGLPGLARSIANEFSAFGITINCLLPGYTSTQRLKSLNLSDQTIKAMIPAGRLAEPSELADLATFLASEKGAYITGQSIAIDGGLLNGH